MLEPAEATALVALGAASMVLAAGGQRTSRAAIHLAVIAVRTQHNLLAATQAQKQPGRAIHGRPEGRQPKVLDGIAPAVQHCGSTTFIGTV